MNLCPTSGKRCYASPAQAKRCCRKISNRLRVYLCPDCRCFHTTSKVSHRGKP